MRIQKNAANHPVYAPSIADGMKNHERYEICGLEL
jgi:hypothetical protein